MKHFKQDKAMLRVCGLGKRFGDFAAVRDVSFDLEEGQFLSLLGPSGCGKTTTLRMIAGFERPTSGLIQLAGRDITRAPARDRNIGMVFQSYALFPHLTVANNVAFGLRMRRIGRAEIEKRVGEALRVVRMEAYAERYPGRLSGGQQQRVALARALVIRPDLLLLDEPLSALDLKLREEMREEIHRITRELGITTIFVTHDQGEALVLSDRIAVMNQGTIEQLDRPEVLYRSPATPFVADFIGGSNVLEGSIEVTPDGPVFRCGDVTLFPVGHATAPGGRCAISIRPEDIRIVPESEPGGVPGRIERRRFLGSTIEYAIRLTGDLSVTVREHREGGPREGDRVGVAIPTERVVFLAPSSEVAAGKS